MHLGPVGPGISACLSPLRGETERGQLPTGYKALIPLGWTDVLILWVSVAWPEFSLMLEGTELGPLRGTQQCHQMVPTGYESEHAHAN